jgi:hypothetical protein
MFVFSNMHPWQGVPAVQQVLMFSCAAMREQFNKNFCEITENHKPEKVSVASDSNLGAIYKLKAVLGSDGSWQPVIRCGFTGIWLQGMDPVATPEQAIAVCKEYLKKEILSSF